MFDLFHIILFTPFYFPDGKTSAKPKYFIPIHKEGENIIYAYLPTSKDFIPGDLIKHGCVEIPKRQISCYIFRAGVQVTTCGFCFERDTFVYAYQMGEFSQALMSDIYENKDVDYTIVGKLSSIERESFINCLLNSPFVKRKIKKALASKQ